jgi:hypothetical protein
VLEVVAVKDVPPGVVGEAIRNRMTGVVVRSPNAFRKVTTSPGRYRPKSTTTSNRC